jgi:CheY-like chemotaxis protein
VLDDIIKFSNTNADNYVADEIEFNLRTAIAKVADLISACAWEKGLETSTIVHADVPGTLTGDPLRLRQILLILAVNAITFTRAGEIAISVQRDLSEEALAQTKKDPTKVYLRFEVSDTGDGLSPERRQYLASVRTTKKPPQNDEDMGMVLFRRQVDLLGGETGIESEQGLGSTFWFTARFSVKDAPEYHMLPEAASINGIRCLIVGDNPTSRKVLSLYINQWGGYCSEASSAAGAVEQLQTALDIKCFDVAMVNFKSEALDQYKAVAAAIRHHRNLDTLSLICITSMAKKGDAKLLSNYGYSAYLTKPIKPGHLYNSLLMIREFQEDPTPIKSEPIITKHLLDEISRDRYRILVVEDNPKNTKVVVGLLNRLTIMCDVAASGKEAMEAFSNKNYDMIIIGCRLPDMDGYQASRAIRQLERQAQREGTAAKAHIPILALTADAQAEDRDRCLASGMDDLITEPVHFDKMRAMIKNYLD